MSYAKLNIWLRYADCRLITDCWRTDLVIKTCGGDYVTDMDPIIIDQLRQRYADYTTVDVIPQYAGEKRIRLMPGVIPPPPNFKPIYHIEVDVPPGCYVIWTRVCHRVNEDTNRVMVIVGCGDEACVNLILNDLYMSMNDIFHPFLERAVELKIPKRDLQVVANVMMKVGEKPKKEVIAELGQRLEEAKEIEDVQLQNSIGSILDATKGIAGPQ